MSVEQSKAIKTINPDAEFSIREGVITWVTDPIPSDEIAAKQEELQAEYDSQTYARNRATAYASTGDQLDMQYWDSVNGTTTWKDHVASIKNKFPKV